MDEIPHNQTSETPVPPLPVSAPEIPTTSITPPPVVPVAPNKGLTRGQLTSLGLVASIVLSTVFSDLFQDGLSAFLIVSSPFWLYVTLACFHYIQGDRQQGNLYASAAIYMIIVPFITIFVIFFLLWAYCAMMGVQL